MSASNNVHKSIVEYKQTKIKSAYIKNIGGQHPYAFCLDFENGETAVLSLADVLRERGVIHGTHTLAEGESVDATEFLQQDYNAEIGDAVTIYKFRHGHGVFNWKVDFSNTLRVGDHFKDGRVVQGGTIGCGCRTCSRHCE